MAVAERITRSLAPALQRDLAQRSLANPWPGTVLGVVEDVCFCFLFLVFSSFFLFLNLFLFLGLPEVPFGEYFSIFFLGFWKAKSGARVWSLKGSVWRVGDPNRWGLL